MKYLSTLQIIGSIALLTACSGGEQQPADKKTQLEALKKQQAELSVQIETLQKEIAATDTTAAPVNIKMVSVDVVKASTFSHYVEIQGKIDTDNNVMISCEMGGTIKKVNVKRGDNVSKGQVLAEVDNTLIRKGIEQLQTSLDLATTVYEKTDKLWKENIGTEVQYLQAKANKEALESQMESLKVQLKKTQITSPFDGYVDEVYKKEGELMAPGFPAFNVVNSSNFKVVGELAESYVSKVKEGDEIEIYCPDVDVTITEKISVVGNVINPVNRTFIVEAKITNKGNMLKANLVAYLKIKDYSRKNSIVVPINTVQTSRNGQFIYVANQNVVEKRDVDVENTYGSFALVANGLKEGDKIITFGYNDLTEGQTIKY
ncbi:MAG: efflux RND transporter periplasmic adaptor subunit [Cytophagales bacterium]|nr:efflux RND transporter periplasmic adaptor subunit [Cytophagales bacterium]